MVILFNNCRSRPHAQKYREGAFFDLDTADRHGHLVDALAPGTPCVVASHGERGMLIFDWFSFTHEELLNDEDGFPTRVFFGEPLRTETIPKSAICSTQPYAVLFTKNGHFKQLSVRRHE